MMAEFSVKEVESGTGGTLTHGSRDTVFSSVSIDTRNLKSGGLFFAIRGPNRDGHRFVPDALSKGAAGAVVERGYECPGEFPGVLIKVGDTHKALKDLAMSVRQKWPGTLVGITGSMGKTTTREFAAQILRSRFNVYQTPGNYNNLFGLPLALFGLSREHDFGIFEMGMSAPGEIAEMCRIASPVIGVITNVAPVHLEYFSSIEEIARAKAELAEALPADGMLVYNADDPLVREIARNFAGRRISFGFAESADIRADHVEIAGPEETRFELYCNGTLRKATLPLAGAHYALNTLPGIALGNQYKIPVETMVQTLSRLQSSSMRGRVLRFKQGITVIDDSYNSNPRALMQMIEVLASIPSFPRRILVAGEMLELGNSAGPLHYECGAFAANHGLDMVVGIQGAASEIVRAALESGMSEEQSRFFADSEAAAAFIEKSLNGGDLVLVKGSRGVHTEKVIQRLQTHFES